MTRKAVLLPTYDRVLAHRKQAALSGAADQFGTDVETPFAWLEDAWERFGDGTRLITSLERAFAVKEVAGDLAQTDGVVSLLCRFFADAVGSAELEAVLADGSHPAWAALSHQEAALVKLVGPYRALLASRGMVEPGDALATLKGQDLPFTFTFPEPFEMTPAFSRFFEGAAEPEPTLIKPADPAVKLRFLAAGGPTAEPSLILTSVLESLDEAAGAGAATGPARILVASSQAQALFDFCALELAKRYVSVVLASQVPFNQTDFGRAFLALFDFLTDEHHDLDALLDYVLSPFSGIEEAQAAEIVSMVRGNRLLSFEEAHAMVRLMSPHFDEFEELIQDSDASLLLDYFVDVAADIPGKDPAYRSEQGSAIAALRRVYETARTWGVSPEDMTFALNDIQVGLTRQAAAKDACATVIFASTEKAATLANQPFWEVLVANLDSRFHTAGERHDALVTLLAKLGLSSTRSALDGQRQWFEALKGAATCRFTCERALSSGGDEEVYPSFLWDEFVECYAQPGDELDDLGLAPALEPFARTLGEERFAATLYADGHAAPPTLDLAPASPGKVGADFSNLLFLSRISTPQQDVLVLSPSAIEAYVNCPYRWFVSQRLRPNSPEEELGPLEMGTFVHSVFQQFYAQLPQVLGSERVTPDNLARAQELLGQVFDEVLKAQPELDGTRYVPLTPVEQAEAQKLKQTLLDNVRVQSRLLSRFVPTYHELAISPKELIMYAGVVIRGRVDRVDTDADQGHYVVVDYKGGIAGHDAGYDPDDYDAAKGASFKLPHKIQALIYAQALRQKLDMRPVGALYLSYRAQEAKGSVAGSYDAAQLNLSGIARKASAVEYNFGSYLNLVEEMVAARMDDLMAGNIEQRPLCADSCKYCPATSCSRRLS